MNKMGGSAEMQISVLPFGFKMVFSKTEEMFIQTLKLIGRNALFRIFLKK